MSRRFEDDSLGQALSGVDAPRPRNAFRSDLRRALVATAASEWTARRLAPRAGFSFSLFGPAPRLALAFAVVVFAALGTSGAAAASSLPGDAAYPVKLAYEQVEFSLASDDAAKVEVLAHQADRRLDELNKVSKSRPQLTSSATASYQETLARFQAALQALRGGPADERHDAAVNVAVAAAEKHVAQLESMQEQNDDNPGLSKALEQAKEIEREAKDEQGDQQSGSDRGKGRQSARPTPTHRPTGTPRATPTRTPKPQYTPRIDDPNPGDN